MASMWFEKANWIFAKNSTEEVHEKYYDYEMTFSVQQGQKVQLYISAHSNYALWINGQFADCGQLPDYESRQIYDTLDITHLVKPGENLLEITQYVAGRAFSTGRPAIPAVIFADFLRHFPWNFADKRYSVTSTRLPFSSTL